MLYLFFFRVSVVITTYLHCMLNFLAVGDLIEVVMYEVVDILRSPSVSFVSDQLFRSEFLTTLTFVAVSR